MEFGEKIGQHTNIKIVHHQSGFREEFVFCATIKEMSLDFICRKTNWPVRECWVNENSDLSQPLSTPQTKALSVPGNSAAKIDAIHTYWF